MSNLSRRPMPSIPSYHALAMSSLAKRRGTVSPLLPGYHPFRCYLGRRQSAAPRHMAGMRGAGWLRARTAPPTKADCRCICGPRVAAVATLPTQGRHDHAACQVHLARYIRLHAPRVRGGGVLRAALERRDAPAEAQALLQPVRLRLQSTQRRTVRDGGKRAGLTRAPERDPQARAGYGSRVRPKPATDSARGAGPAVQTVGALCEACASA